MRKWVKAHVALTVAAIGGIITLFILGVAIIAALFALIAGNKCSGDSNNMSPNGAVSSSANLNDNAKNRKSDV